MTVPAHVQLLVRSSGTIGESSTRIEANLIYVLSPIDQQVEDIMVSNWRQSH